VEVLLPRHVDPVVRDGKIEGALLRLDLVPGYWHQHGIEMHPRQLRQDNVRLRRSPGRRIAGFAAQNKKRFSVDDELLGTPWLRITGKPSPLTVDSEAAKPNDSTADSNTSFTATSFGTGMQDNSVPTQGCTAQGDG
jgi:hypothetical protein